jgi:FAD/FMN-containing dehydrogenase
MTEQTRRVGPGIAATDALRGSLRGSVFTPDDESYNAARAVYNGMIDRRPAVVAQCVDAGDVIRALDWGRSHGLDIAVKGGGHSGPGFGVIDDGLVLDLSPMRWVRVDPQARTAHVGGGSLLGDLDHATHAFGLATPTGIASTTGVGGLTLGGGHGYLSRRYGLTIDNLLGVDIILADGAFVRASESENDDLFWAVRGGGGNLGVVTSFTLRLHPVENVGVGITLWPIDDIPAILRWYREFLPAAPEELYGFFAVIEVPPGPPFPEEIQARKMAAVVWCYTGDLDRLGQALEPALDPATPAFHFTTPMPYPILQTMFDELLPAGLQWYWRGDFFDRISDDAIDIHLKFGSSIPTMRSTMHLYPIDLAPQRVGKTDTAWSYRDAVWSGVIGGIDPDPANRDAIREWSTGYWEALHPHSMGGGYLNFMMDEGQDRVRTTYRENYDRLTQVKAKFDPDNVFHVNHNITPAV